MGHPTSGHLARDLIPRERRMATLFVISIFTPTNTAWPAAFPHHLLDFSCDGFQSIHFRQVCIMELLFGHLTIRFIQHYCCTDVDQTR